MSLTANNVLPFPTWSRRKVGACPNCGTHTALWRIGRLLWGHCHEHAVRWVAADLNDAGPGMIDLGQLRERLERLSQFVEITH
ncbi:MAG: hypothetical protein OER80_04010 [Gammaproteobacteria bacterium]|nr:hypothetical protein [Gammaproteobacteria bacterium]MDH3767782.1 hypothetical protein [Gammaproteobacteria bacterium]